jgi:predicted nuclease of predicted toxin-antitoxin system
VKFIVDAQLPKSLSLLLNHKGYDSIHTLDLPKKNESSDEAIIDISSDQNRVVITKDYDFLESFLVKSIPKKLILVRTGNIPNSFLIRIFTENLPHIISMISRSNLVEINRAEIVEHD